MPQKLKEDFNEYMKKYMLNRYHKRRMRFIQELGSTCVDCGSDKDLELDHKDADKKSFDISKALAGMSETRLEEEIKKCVVRCKTCHLRKTILERGQVPLSDRPHGSLRSYRAGCRCEACRKAIREHRRNKREMGP